MPCSRSESRPARTIFALQIVHVNIQGSLSVTKGFKNYTVETRRSELGRGFRPLEAGAGRALIGLPFQARFRRNWSKMYRRRALRRLSPRARQWRCRDRAARVCTPMLAVAAASWRSAWRTSGRRFSRAAPSPTGSGRVNRGGEAHVSKSRANDADGLPVRVANRNKALRRAASRLGMTPARLRRRPGG